MELDQIEVVGGNISTDTGRGSELVSLSPCLEVLESSLDSDSEDWTVKKCRDNELKKSKPLVTIKIENDEDIETEETELRYTQNYKCKECCNSRDKNQAVQILEDDEENIPKNTTSNREKIETYTRPIPKSKSKAVGILEEENLQQNTTTNTDKTETYSTKKPKSKLYKCIVCNKVYNYKNWHEHMVTCHSVLNIICPKCGKLFHSQRYYTKHMKKHHEIMKYDTKVKLVTCELCSKVFSNSWALTTHYKTVHSEEKYKCDICKSELKCRTYLLSHKLRVHFNDGKIHSCKLCGKKYKSPRYVNVHMKNCHAGGAGVCVCGQSCSSKYLLKKHIANCPVANQ